MTPSRWREAFAADLRAALRRSRPGWIAPPSRERDQANQCGNEKPYRRRQRNLRDVAYVQQHAVVAAKAGGRSAHAQDVIRRGRQIGMGQREQKTIPDRRHARVATIFE